MAEHKQEYLLLSKEEKDTLVSEYTNVKLVHDAGRHIGQPSKAKYISDKIKKFEQEMINLHSAAGIQGFICLFFTDKSIESYLPTAVGARWDTIRVGSKLVSFAVASCNVLGMLRSSAAKAVYLKTMICERVNAKLSEITGLDNVQMQYLNYEWDIVQHFGVELVGWTAEFVNLSQLSNALAPLQELADALEAGTCKFVQLTTAECRPRKKRADAGQPRGPRKKRGVAEVGAGMSGEETRNGDKGNKWPRISGNE
ncbi:hypothetical protein BU17DRAFT_100793 [Hysterangium stoloniferum]|nr:hypothetical protein BU17DRAFT_100793 [Hysterangium stoloniferum]